MTILLIMFLSVTSVISSLTPPRGQLDSDEIRQAIDKENAQYIRSFKQADAAGVASVYDERGSRLTPKGVVIRGREAIKTDLAEFLKQVGSVTATLKTVELWIIDDLAYETGKWSYTFKPPSQEQKTIGGRYVTVWKKQKDGGWKMLVDMGIPED